MKYCPNCGHALAVLVPTGDNRPRAVCSGCGAIHYQNPRVIVGCVPEWQGRILLCRRAIEPRRGYWTIPAGFLENGESLQAGAARESLEEACAHVEIGSLLAVVNVLYAEQVHVMFRARMLAPDYATSVESLEVGLIEAATIPWNDIAFPSVRFALQHYLADRDCGSQDLHFHDIQQPRAAGTR
ncbi:MAG: NUDIX hydrolase [Gammaproteobacteria bacterium]|nr:NUDIX hydrolase [Gammaproteobacteria bacterium]